MKQIFKISEPIGKIQKAGDLFLKIKKIKIDFNQENFLLICLNTKNQIIKSEVVFIGGLSECLITPQTIFRKALLNNASRIIIAHNHPSDDLEPSQEDKEIYRHLKECGEMLQIKVLDNIIFNKKEFYSFQEGTEV